MSEKCDPMAGIQIARTAASVRKMLAEWDGYDAERAALLLNALRLACESDGGQPIWERFPGLAGELYHGSEIVRGYWAEREEIVAVGFDGNGIAEGADGVFRMVHGRYVADTLTGVLLPAAEDVAVISDRWFRDNAAEERRFLQALHEAHRDGSLDQSLVDEAGFFFDSATAAALAHDDDLARRPAFVVVNGCWLSLRIVDVYGAPVRIGRNAIPLGRAIRWRSPWET